MTRARDLADSADKDISGTLVLDDITLSNDISIADNGKAIFGAGSDLQIYHDGSNSYISDQGTGNIILDADDSFQVKRGANYSAYFDTNAEVTLYHNNAAKLATTSTGIDVTGTAVTDGLTVAGNVSVDGGTIKLDGNYPVGTGNVALGDTALDSNVSGASNTAIGANALTANTASNNTAVGWFTLYNNSTGTANTAVGGGVAGSVLSTMENNTTGGSNSAFGIGALGSNTTASNNTAVGYQAGYSNTTGANLTAVGRKAAYFNSTGTDNTAIGHDVFFANTTGSYNTALGKHALASNTTASYNTAVGYQAGYSNTTGTENAAFGTNALFGNTTSSENTAVGYQAGYGNTTGVANVFIGRKAGYTNTTSGAQTMVGTGAGQTTTGQYNTFIGNTAGYHVSSGQKNTILGRYNGNQGGLDIRTSSNNIVLSDGDGNVRAHCDSSGTWTGIGGATQLLSTVTVSSNVTYVTFSLPSGYNYYELRCEDVIPTVSGTLRAQLEAGGNYQTGASDYYKSTNDASDHIQLSRENITADSTGGYVMVTIFSAKNTGSRTAVLGQSLPGTGASTYNFTSNQQTGGVLLDNAEVTAIRIFASGASITSGVFRLYGRV